jgi:hypothetical protein
MMIRGSWARVVKFAGVIAVVAGLLVLANFPVAARRVHQAQAGMSQASANGASRLALPKQDSGKLGAYGKLPMSFIENQGQTSREVRYVSHGGGYELFLAPQEADLAIRGPIHVDLSPRNRFATLRALRDARQARRATTTAFVRMHLEGANPEAQIVGTDSSPER